MNQISPLDRANQEQQRAADPTRNVFVSASAGSGKTKLLTDRLLRLMLAPSAGNHEPDPSRILCLTFTKAAAAEMSLRLQKDLGRWVTLDDAALDAELAQRAIPIAAETRIRARALFARVLDLPGGMRISTIHSFCQSLLRRFPLEAQISPHFQVVEAADDETALQSAREESIVALTGAGGGSAEADALDHLAGIASVRDFKALVDDLHKHPERMEKLRLIAPAPLTSMLARAADLPHEQDEAIIAAGVEWHAIEQLRDALRIMSQEASRAAAARALKMLDWLALPAPLRAERWLHWTTELLTGEGKARAISTICNDKLAAKYPELLDICAAEQARILAIEEARKSLRMVRATAALLLLARPVLHAYQLRKERAGQLDYNDLIRRTLVLLRDPGAAWVLFKLDGGIDHVLLDEVQDTAPEQWRIAGAITDEFFAGQGAHNTPRTFFAVGDRKQSIYSFQGANVAEFEAQRARFRDLVETAGYPWLDASLDVSFRSTAPVLALVDAVFALPIAARGVVARGETLAHIANRAPHAGAVELWPLAPRPAEADAEELPDHNQGQTSAEQTLVTRLADWIAAETSGATPLPSRGRPLAPGDILILVRRRTRFAAALVGALKARNIPVAGLDRLVLTEQPAVQDLLALCDTLLLPQDDLALACVLTSPLGGLTDDSLMALAAERKIRLWDALRTRAHERPDWQTACDFLTALFAQVDYATPHSLLAQALGPLGARARLFARLGAEAAEPIDELLSAALTFEASHPPSLQTFVHWLRQSAAEVKREASAAGGAVRIMTVHGAKGLQAPVVILPDTTSLPKQETGLLWAQDPITKLDLPLWAPRAELTGPVAKAARDAQRAQAMEEFNRLLYVALTRAEDRLLVCGWAPKSLATESWYSLVEQALRSLSPEEHPFDSWDGTVLRITSPQLAPAVTAPSLAIAAQPAPLPAWAGAAPLWQAASPPDEPARPRPLAPSRPEGIELGPTPPAASPLLGGTARGIGLKHGQLVHSLLQHLPAILPSERAATARRYAARDAGPHTDRLVGQVLAILDHPAMAPLFGPTSRAEVPLSGVIGHHVIGGLIDRLVILPDRILLADFKTNRLPPETPAQVPVRYLRQLAAYRAILEHIHPDRPVSCLLVWTQTGQVMPLPADLLAPHVPTA
jgi:ATP-dependent helicase/nuclease subunit A